MCQTLVEDAGHERQVPVLMRLKIQKERQYISKEEDKNSKSAKKKINEDTEV